MKRLMFSTLPFRDCNHIFLCERSQYCIGMYVYCTKSSLSNKKISDYINKSVYVYIEEFPASVSEGTVIAEKIHFSLKINAFIGKFDPFGRSKSFESLYYKSISSPFLLWKMYPDTLCKTVFNVSEKFFLPILLSSVRGSCRSFTACTSENFPGLKSKTIKTVFFKMLVEVCLYLIRSSCKNVNWNFIHDVYRSYKEGRAFFSCFLEFGKNE